MVIYTLFQETDEEIDVEEALRRGEIEQENLCKRIDEKFKIFEEKQL